MKKKGHSREGYINDYEGFVEKFKPKKTTDDCYTLPEVYDTVLRWVDANILPVLPESGSAVRIMRPFRPGGDYTKEDYSGDCVVIDNPPFSILAKIRNWYQERGIRYFLFAPSLTCLSSTCSAGDTAIVCNADIRYENGAVVRTAFVTNMTPDLAVWLCGDLGKAIKTALAEEDKRPPVYVYDPHVITAATLQKYAQPGVEWKIRREDCSYVRKLDLQEGRSIFGNGYLISERAAAERAAAERAAAERAAAERAAAERAAARETHYWKLSEREWDIIRAMPGV